MTAAMGIDFLYTNIGRGHPCYLDGIVESLCEKRCGALIGRERDVFQVSRGASRLAWEAVRRLYRSGASNPAVGWWYNRLRRQNDYNRPSLLLDLLGRDIRKAFQNGRTPLLVAHPSLVAALKGRGGLFYQHGELATPGEALVAGAQRVLVPTPEAAGAFVRFGYSANQVMTTGLCIEPPLVAQAAPCFEERLSRLGRRVPLTGAFFSSGAEPRRHVEIILLAIRSVLRRGGRVILFARQGGYLQRRAAAVLGQEAAALGQEADLVITAFRDRREENGLTAESFPSFDYLVAPAHERSNWGLGLGLPLFAVGPAVGSFSPINLEILLQGGVAARLDSPEAARAFGEAVTGESSRKRLAAMARSGWGRHPIDGFARIADYLIEICSDQSARA